MTSNLAPAESPAWLVPFAQWLTPRRLRAHGVILALSLWGVAAADFATTGLFDRAGNIKFQDFLPFYISARLVTEHRASELYNQQTQAEEIYAIIAQPTAVRVPYLYGPQVALLFAPLARFSFQNAARIWIGLSLVIFAVCVYVIWKTCGALSSKSGMVALAALAFPPLFHFIVRGQISALVLACFTAAFLAFRANRYWLGGAALGFLIFKPQFLVAIPLVLLLACAWKPLTALALSASAQLLFARLFFGPAVMNTYFDTLILAPRWLSFAELSLAPIQMHSLRAFWMLLIPWPKVALTLYVLSSIAVIATAATAWKSSLPIPIRFSALSLAAVLVNPHLFIYDLLVLAPVLLLLAEWTVTDQDLPAPTALGPLLYLVFLLPLLGPLSRWTHLQISVPVFAALLFLISRFAKSKPSPVHRF